MSKGSSKSSKLSYQETLKFLYENLPMFQRQGAPAMKKNLDNIKALCDNLGNPQNDFPSIHIAGTNGKGSTAHMLSAILQSQGFRVGVYTSPHYKDFRERIKINAVLMSRQFVVDFIADNMMLIEDIRPSFFEITVAMAFQYFAIQKVDYAIVEVGLGGRLDSTNIITPLISVITNISKDHTQFLGESLAEIAGEKAGIIKENIPVVIGEKQVEIQHVFVEKAKENNSQLIFAEDQVNVHFQEKESIVKCAVGGTDIEFHAEWFADFQVANLTTAFATLQQFSLITSQKINWGLIPSALSDLPKLTYFVGRWMTLGESPKIITDSAHNEAGIRKIMSKLSEISYVNLHIVVGFSNDKNLDTVLPYFPSNAIYYFAKANIPRGLDAKILKEKAMDYKLFGRSYVSVKNAFRAAKRQATTHDLIYVGGSIFVVAEVV